MKNTRWSTANTRRCLERLRTPLLASERNTHWDVSYWRGQEKRAIQALLRMLPKDGKYRIVTHSAYDVYSDRWRHRIDADRIQ